MAKFVRYFDKTQSIAFALIESYRTAEIEKTDEKGNPYTAHAIYIKMASGARFDIESSQHSDLAREIETEIENYHNS